MKSINSFLYHDVQKRKQTSTGDHLVVSAEEEEREFQRCVETNAIWNAKISEERDADLRKEREIQRIKIAERLQIARERREKEFAAIESVVSAEKIKSGSYIQLDNFEDAIKHALANPIDVNYSIDLDGNMQTKAQAEATNAAKS